MHASLVWSIQSKITSAGYIFAAGGVTLRRILLLIMEAVALNDFTHQSNEDELPFRKGSILKVKF